MQCCYDYKYEIFENEIREANFNIGHDVDSLKQLKDEISSIVRKVKLPYGSLAIAIGNDISFNNYINHDCVYYVMIIVNGATFHIQYITLEHKGMYICKILQFMMKLLCTYMNIFFCRNNLSTSK